MKEAKPQFGLWLRGTPSDWRKEQGRQWFGKRPWDNKSSSTSPEGTNSQHQLDCQQHGMSSPAMSYDGGGSKAVGREVRREEFCQLSPITNSGVNNEETKVT